jgi:hypothetical protein
MTAIFSPCGKYRYRLERQIDMFGGPIIGFCLHNPSVAGEILNDPTSRRGIGFATSWQGSALIYVNVWAGIATRPVDLWKMDDPVGPDNDRHIFQAAQQVKLSGGFMIAAWGKASPPAHVDLSVRKRLVDVQDTILSSGCEIRCVGMNADGSPRHPLYVKRDTLPTAWHNKL